MHNIRRVIAFTLAEVLIVLGIIGVVAEMTIPTLISNVDDQVAVVALKKEASVLQQAITTINVDYVGIENWTSQSNLNNALSEVNSILTQYLKVSKNCGTGSGCFPPYYRLLSSKLSTQIDYNAAPQFSKMVLADGSILFFGIGNYSTRWNEIDFFVDVNGFKGPNRWGYDTFRFQVYSDYLGSAWGYKPQILYPWGWPPIDTPLNQQCSSITTDSDIGFGDSCTSWAYYKGNLDYKYVDDLNWSTKTHK